MSDEDRECDFCRWDDVATKEYKHPFRPGEPSRLCSLCAAAVTEGVAGDFGIGNEGTIIRPLSRTVLYAAHWIVEQLKGAIEGEPPTGCYAVGFSCPNPVVEGWNYCEDHLTPVSE